MDTDTIATLLGKRSTDAEVESALQRFGVRRRPELEIDPNDVDGPVVKSQDWVSNLSAGIEFGFQEEAAFVHLDRATGGMGPMIVTEVYFYGERPGARPYPWPLPFGLLFSDSRGTVRAKMAPLDRARRSYVRDTWDYPAFRITVSYVDDFSRIDFLICMLRAEAPELFETTHTIVPSVDAMIRLLGKSIDDALVRQTLRPFGVDRGKVDNGNHHVIDLCRAYGFKLHFRKSTAAGRALFLNAIECLRAAGLDSRGWQGDLPFGIRFDDSPEMVLGKIGQAPTRQDDQEFSGQAFWELREYSLQVTYSTMENIVLSVSIFAPQTHL